MKLYFIFTVITFSIFGCTEIEKIIKKESPHEKYEQMLRSSGLIDSELGKAWVKASNDAMNNALQIEPPYKEQSYFFNDNAAAFSYKFKGNRGEKILITLDKDTVNPYQVFLDLFRTGNETEKVAFADGSENRIEYEIDKDADYIIRIQPELLKGGSFIFEISKGPSLAFPVSGKNSIAVGSVWGASRDGGIRSHEGVDIFAPKRTPVLAAADGIISRTGTNNLGGKVVWLYADGKSLYYAHLDSQLVSPGTVVSIGDTLGLVGNTGNARTTPPHLHFGIYSRGEGAINPYPFIKNVYPEAENVKVSKTMIGQWGRINKTSAYLRSSKDIKSEPLAALKRNTPFLIYGGSGNRYKVRLPGGETGFILSSDIESADKPYANIQAAAGNLLNIILDDDSSFILAEAPYKSLPVHGSYNDYSLVMLKDKLVLVKKES